MRFFDLAKADDYDALTNLDVLRTLTQWLLQAGLVSRRHSCPPLPHEQLGPGPHCPLELLEADPDDERIRCWYCRWFLEPSNRCFNAKKPHKLQMRGMLHRCDFFEARLSGQK